MSPSVQDAETAQIPAAPRASVDDLNRWGVTGFDRLYGLQFETCGDDEVTAHVHIDEQHKQPTGIVHGGLYASIAESIATIATVVSLAGQEKHTVGQSNNTSFLRPITQGTAHATGHRRHAGRTTWIWDIEITDDNGHTCALTRMTIAIRPINSTR